jgi:hypothetical protein
MARCTNLLLARSVSVDPFTNSLTIVDIAEGLKIEATEPPKASEESPLSVGPFGWVMVALLQRDDPNVAENPIIRISIVSPRGREFPGPDAQIDLTTASNARNLALMPSFPYTGDGVYRFLLKTSRNSDWITIGEFTLPMTITVRTPEVVPGQITPQTIKK